MKEKGNISINTENIFPIIKKFLYSDQDIFLRELISNAVDATQKIKSLSQMGEMKDELGDLTIEIKLDAKKKTITISDKGIGMSADEIKKYINQIAFSGATEFIEKYKEKDDSSQIIGHFGLGFYSAFMVSKYVEINSKSYIKKNKSAYWKCDGNTRNTNKSFVKNVIKERSKNLSPLKKVSSKDISFKSSSVSDLEIGLKVRHPNFGIGEILELDMKNNQNKAIVKFKSVGEKTLLLNFAKLKIIK